MKHTVYLPDDVSEAAKTAELNLSGLLRDAVTDELERRATVSKTLAAPTEHLVDVEDPDGRTYTGRITGEMLHASDNDTSDPYVYLTDDERVLVWDPGNLTIHEIDDYDALRELLADDAYVEVMTALGEKPIIDL